MVIKFAAAVSLGFAAFAAAAHATPINLVANGNFAQTTYASNNEFGTSYGGQGVTDWTGNGGYNLYFLAGTASTVSANTQYGGNSEKLYSVASGAAGGNFVALDGDPAVEGGISQTISGLNVGGTYSLSFAWGAGQVQSRTGATTEQLAVSLGSQTHSTNVINNPSQSFTGWLNQTFTFTATSTSELLSFLSEGTPGGLPPIATLDSVSLVQQVPEPVSLGVLGIGLAGLGLVRRRSTRTRAA